MADRKEKVCPECNGKKVILGTCVCDSEWRGTQVGNEWEDCHCMPEITCHVCHGTGIVTTSETIHD